MAIKGLGSNEKIIPKKKKTFPTKSKGNSMMDLFSNIVTINIAGILDDDVELFKDKILWDDIYNYSIIDDDIDNLLDIVGSIEYEEMTDIEMNTEFNTMELRWLETGELFTNEEMITHFNESPDDYEFFEFRDDQNRFKLFMTTSLKDGTDITPISFYMIKNDGRIKFYLSNIGTGRSDDLIFGEDMSELINVHIEDEYDEVPGEAYVVGPEYLDSFTINHMEPLIYEDDDSGYGSDEFFNDLIDILVRYFESFSLVKPSMRLSDYGYIEFEDKLDWINQTGTEFGRFVITKTDSDLDHLIRINNLDPDNISVNLVEHTLWSTESRFETIDNYLVSIGQMNPFIANQDLTKVITKKGICIDRDPFSILEDIHMEMFFEL